MARRLAAVLLLEGAGLAAFSISYGASALYESLAGERAPTYLGVGWLVFVVILLATPWAVLGVVARLDTPLVTWLRKREGWLIAGPALLIVLVGASIAAARDFSWVVPLPLLFGLLVVPLYSLAAAISAWRRAPKGTIARDRARAFAVAFGVRDVLILIAFLGMRGFGADDGASVAACEAGACPTFLTWLGWNWILLAPAIAVLGYAPLLAYGMLKTQLFDIDIRIKRGLASGMLLAIFAAAFFVAEQIGQQLLSERAGPIAGLAGAGFLALAFAPLHRLTRRLADRALPEATGSPEYVARRKIEVYRAAVEAALDDGEISERERVMLNRLAADLVLGPADMLEVEREASIRHGAPAGGLGA